MKYKSPGIFAGIIFCLLLLPVFSFSQVPEEIVKSLNTGDAKTLSKYFNQTVELDLPGLNNTYSKAQAQQITTKFFLENSPEKFVIIRKGGPEDARYYIGNLQTKQEVFRVFFVLKKSDEKLFIHKFKIEKLK